MIKVISFDIGGTLIENNESFNEMQKYNLKNLTKLVNQPYEKVRETYKLVFQKSKGTFNSLVKKFCDELNVLECIYGMKETQLEYVVKENLKMDSTLRQIKEAKKLIVLEINNLYQNKDIAKLKYLYYEYKKENIDDIDYIYEEIMHDLNKEFNEDILKLYYIIKLSYHSV